MVEHVEEGSECKALVFQFVRCNKMKTTQTKIYDIKKNKTCKVKYKKSLIKIVKGYINVFDIFWAVGRTFSLGRTDD